jgi:hypothetical protein
MEGRALTLELVEGRYAVVRLGPGDPVPAWGQSGPFVSVTRTDAELSIVCLDEAVPAPRPPSGWRCLRVRAPRLRHDRHPRQPGRAPRVVGGEHLRRVDVRHRLPDGPGARPRASGMPARAGHTVEPTHA